MPRAKEQRTTLVESWKEALANGTAGARCDELIRQRHADGAVPKALAKLVTQPKRV